MKVSFQYQMPLSNHRESYFKGIYIAVQNFDENEFKMKLEIV